MEALDRCVGQLREDESPDRIFGRIFRPLIDIDPENSNPKCALCGRLGADDSETTGGVLEPDESLRGRGPLPLLGQFRRPERLLDEDLVTSAAERCGTAWPSIRTLEILASGLPHRAG